MSVQRFKVGRLYRLRNDILPITDNDINIVIFVTGIKNLWGHMRLTYYMLHNPNMPCSNILEDAQRMFVDV